MDVPAPDRQGIGPPSFKILTGPKKVKDPFFNMTDINSYLYAFFSF